MTYHIHAALPMTNYEKTAENMWNGKYHSREPRRMRHFPYPTKETTATKDATQQCDDTHGKNIHTGKILEVWATTRSSTRKTIHHVPGASSYLSLRVTHFILLVGYNSAFLRESPPPSPSQFFFWRLFDRLQFIFLLQPAQAFAIGNLLDKRGQCSQVFAFVPPLYIIFTCLWYFLRIPRGRRKHTDNFSLMFVEFFKLTLSRSRIWWPAATHQNVM